MPYLAFGKIEFPSPIGTFVSKISYLPVTTDYKGAEFIDKENDGLLAQLGWEGKFWLRRNLRLGVGFGATWINDEYANAIYSVEYPPDQLKVFSASGGIQDAHSSLSLMRMFTEYWAQLP